LRATHTPETTPHVHPASYIVDINAEKLPVTGTTATHTINYHHPGYIGNLKSISFEKLIAKAPQRIIEIAVKGMLPKNPLGRQMFRKLKVYAGSEHPHVAQQPRTLEL
ncbi:MAG: 50S ribosomal protein L13, partial [Gammaproteobacteria bacterium]|nr:50S ribosomal protein L13 [Gammaproteobacteria bacterium]